MELKLLVGEILLFRIGCGLAQETFEQVIVRTRNDMGGDQFSHYDGGLPASATRAQITQLVSRVSAF